MTLQWGSAKISVKNIFLCYSLVLSSKYVEFQRKKVCLLRNIYFNVEDKTDFSFVMVLQIEDLFCSGRVNLEPLNLETFYPFLFAKTLKTNVLKYVRDQNFYSDQKSEKNIENFKHFYIYCSFFLTIEKRELMRYMSRLQLKTIEINLPKDRLIDWVYNNDFTLLSGHVIDSRVIKWYEEWGINQIQ